MEDISGHMLLENLAKVWNFKIPSNMQVFCWRLLQNNLPTRGQLRHRGVLVDEQNLNCVFCDSSMEDEIYLFLNCLFAVLVWNRAYRLTGIREVEEKILI